jgi:membrane associated rhomboid family serine protease
MSAHVMPLSAVLIALSILAYLPSLFDKEDAVYSLLYITLDAGNFSGQLLPEVRRGEVWRLLTPIFLHFDLLHICFNLLWVKDLGSLIEKLSGVRVLLALVIVIGLLSNLAQFFFEGPFFGGMSGVVYGLLGYVWMKSKFDPGSGYVLHQQTVMVMLGWFVLCVVGVIGSVANYAHGAGLAVGVIWGFASSKMRPRRTAPQWMPGL